MASRTCVELDMIDMPRDYGNQCARMLVGIPTAAEAESVDLIAYSYGGARWGGGWATVCVLLVNAR